MVVQPISSGMGTAFAEFMAAEAAYLAASGWEKAHVEAGEQHWAPKLGLEWVRVSVPQERAVAEQRSSDSTMAALMADPDSDVGDIISAQMGCDDA
jgi:hypothetical protein